MDVRLSVEQKALRGSVAQVVADLGPSAVGQLADAERTAKLDAAVAAAGWRELRAPDEDGSPWATGVEVAVVAEQLARGLADAAFLGPTLAAELRRLAGAPPAAVPETLALAADLRVLAVAADERLPDAAVAIDAAGAVAALALAPTTGGWSLVVVEVGAPSPQVDLTRPGAPAGGAQTAALPGQRRVLDDGDLERLTALALATTAADLVGTMHGAVELACGHATDRRQFGQPVGAYQAVQHLLADAFVLAEGARSAALHAAWAVDALDPSDAVLAGATAKAYAGRAARTVCEIGIQVHGGIGNTWECLAHLHLRRALLSTEIFGGVEPSLARVLVGHGVGAGPERPVPSGRHGPERPVPSGRH